MPHVRKYPRPKAAEVRRLIDYRPETGQFFWKVQVANNVPAGVAAGSIGRAGYRKIAIRGVHFQAHHLAFVIVRGRWPKAVDHINGNRADNRWINLREATHAENGRNRGAPSNSRTGLKGVFKRGPRSWSAQIYVSLGTFRTAKEAAAAYARAARLLHGPFVHRSIGDQNATR